MSFMLGTLQDQDLNKIERDLIRRLNPSSPLLPRCSIMNAYFQCYFANAFSLPRISLSLEIAGCEGSASMTSYQMNIPSLWR